MGAVPAGPMLRVRSGWVNTYLVHPASYRPPRERKRTRVRGDAIAFTSGSSERTGARNGYPPTRLGRVTARGVVRRRRDLGDSLILRLAGGPEAAAVARQELRKLRADIDPPLMETLRLLVTELVANSVRHAHAETLTLRVAVGRTSVLTEVTDPGPGFDPEDTGAPSSDGGWGLFLVERLSQRWGVARDGASTRVWFELQRV